MIGLTTKEILMFLQVLNKVKLKNINRIIPNKATMIQMVILMMMILMMMIMMIILIVMIRIIQDLEAEDPILTKTTIDRIDREINIEHEDLFADAK